MKLKILTNVRNCILLLFFAFIISCNDNEMKNVDVTFQYKYLDIDWVENFSLEKIINEDSCVYTYKGKEDIVQWKFVIHNRSGLLRFYFEDNPEFIEARYTISKQVVINGKNKEVKGYFHCGIYNSDLLGFFFTKENGLLLIKHVGVDNVLIKFNQDTSEIGDLIGTIKEDTEFYEWVGREPIYPPSD